MINLFKFSFYSFIFYFFSLWHVSKQIKIKIEQSYNQYKRKKKKEQKNEIQYKNHFRFSLSFIFVAWLVKFIPQVRKLISKYLLFDYLNIFFLIKLILLCFLSRSFCFFFSFLFSLLSFYLILILAHEKKKNKFHLSNPKVNT
jgi:hypothetical protein